MPRLPELNLGKSPGLGFRAAFCDRAHAGKIRPDPLPYAAVMRGKGYEAANARHGPFDLVPFQHGRFNLPRERGGAV